MTKPLPTWDELAPWWRATFAGGADLEYERQILPLCAGQLRGCRRILDLGTGEGQLARLLASNGGEACVVVGVDTSPAQLEGAAEQGGSPRYVRAAGEALPFEGGAFEGVVCCLVVEHVDDADLVLSEAARVLAPGGRFVLVVNHPAVQGPGSGLVDDAVTDERYWRVGPYLKEVSVVEEVDPGVRVRFRHRPLSRYVNPLCEQGLVLTRIEEPAPPLEFLAGSVDLDLEASMPRLCLLRFERR
ncbi:MAG: class I SAM-dependent methyltransferase [Acidimicrobiales bacterium]